MYIPYTGNRHCITILYIPPLGDYNLSGKEAMDSCSSSSPKQAASHCLLVDAFVFALETLSNVVVQIVRNL